MKTLVLSLGGSILLSDTVTASYLTNLVTLLSRITKQYKLYIVVGGGPPARRYITLARQLHLDEFKLDHLGITITRANAQFLTMLLKQANTIIPETIQEAATLSDAIVVMGGTTHGHSTDMVGAELASYVQADRFVNATNVDGIYTKDPNTYKDAKQLKTIHINDLIKKYGTTWESAGKNVIIDGPALKIIKQARLPTLVVNGTRLDQLENALVGKSFDGTTIEV